MSINNNNSPLRYPGGKASLSGFLTRLAELNNMVGGTYCELYAGGAGAALNLLFNNVYRRIHINDADYHIYQFWNCVLNETDDFIAKIETVELSILEWNKQKEIFENPGKYSAIDSAFSAFYLNRTNRSGIIFKAGPIGGVKQEGNYSIGVRFNKRDLIERIIKISTFRDRILLTNLDAIDILNNIDAFHERTDNLFIYLDPPYYNKGKTLYLNNYGHADHLNLLQAINNIDNIKWLISYDNVQPIKDMYLDYRMSTFPLNYTLQSKKVMEELLIFSNDLITPPDITVRSRTSELVLI